jgi:hypothetical protein
MRIFGRARISKTSAFRRMNVAVSSSAAAQAAVMPAAPSRSDELVVADLAETDEMPIVREISYPNVPSAVLSAPSVARPASAPDVLESKTGAAVDTEDGDSDVFVCRRSSPDLDDAAAAAAAAAAAEGVTLFVYGWDNVEPGPLSWAFPSLRAALDAVRTMRNAVEWCIVSGIEWASIDAARAKGAVLVEQNA